MKKLTFILLMLALMLTACGAEAPAEPAAPESMPAEVENPTVMPEPTTTEIPLPTATAEPDFEPLPADAQRMTFTAEDGIELVGYYYPASIPNAPVIVLMHWARGDQNDWVKNGMVDWLQNRSTAHGVNRPSRQSVIYPPLPEGTSFAVFTFDFRGFGESSGDFTSEGGLMDAKAAYEFAKTLESVDPARIGGIGSSIGADGVVDGCADGCLGALSLSPGGYLGVLYAEAVTPLNQAEKPVTCVASEGDVAPANACRSASGEYYTSLIYPGTEHGTAFFYKPPENFGEVLYDWVAQIFKLE